MAHWVIIMTAHAHILKQKRYEGQKSSLISFENGVKKKMERISSSLSRSHLTINRP